MALNDTTENNQSVGRYWGTLLGAVVLARNLSDDWFLHWTDFLNDSAIWLNDFAYFLDYRTDDFMHNTMGLLFWPWKFGFWSWSWNVGVLDIQWGRLWLVVHINFLSRGSYCKGFWLSCNLQISCKVRLVAGYVVWCEENQRNLAILNTPWYQQFTKFVRQLKSWRLACCYSKQSRQYDQNLQKGKLFIDSIRSLTEAKVKNLKDDPKFRIKRRTAIKRKDTEYQQNKAYSSHFGCRDWNRVVQWSADNLIMNK